VQRESMVAGADVNWYLPLGWERGSGGKKFIAAGICNPRGYLNAVRYVPTRPGCRQGSAFVSIIQLRLAHEDRPEIYNSNPSDDGNGTLYRFTAADIKFLDICTGLGPDSPGSERFSSSRQRG
jgi:hypothetical protein